jgi:hypothetical protein
MLNMEGPNPEAQQEYLKCGWPSFGPTPHINHARAAHTQCAYHLLKQRHLFN